MNLSDIFQMSGEMYPEGGVRLSPAACAFILADLESKVDNYQDYLNESREKHGPDSIPVMMSERHLDGLRYVTEAVREGMTNKPDRT